MRELMSQRFLQYMDVLGIGVDAGIEPDADTGLTGT